LRFSLSLWLFSKSFGASFLDDGDSAVGDIFGSQKLLNLARNEGRRRR